MVDVRVLKTGCAGCRKVEQLLLDALREMGVQDANLELIPKEPGTDQTPGLLIDGEQVWLCSPPTKEQLLEWLYQATTVTII
jgi:hypothetical protein